jgi:F0F1-type ATP synthase beta subunit
VLLFYVKECSQREVASFLGLPLSTVNNRLHDARQRMKEWETNMDTKQHEVMERDTDRLSRIGTLVNLNGPLVEARFDPEAASDLFDAVAVVGRDGKAVERMKVSRRLGDGHVQCVLTGDPETLQPGMSLLNTGRVLVTFSHLSPVPSVTAENLVRTIDALRGPTAAAPRFMPTGIKAIDLLCPLGASGVSVQVGTAGVGRVVLLEELGARLGKTETLSLLCLVDRSEPDAYRGWGDTDLRDSKGGVKYYWALSDQGTDPALNALDAADAALYLSPLLAILGLYPALDPEYSRSRLLRPEIVGSEHCAIAERAREALVFAKRAQTDPVLLELLACRAFAAARRRAKSFVPPRDGVDVLQLARARKLQRFLTQPFATAEEYTGWPGVDVSVADTLAGCRAILDGAVDELPESAFAYAGSLSHVHELARGHTARSFR